ncbi:MAG: glycosyltransferase family 4 protein [Candidatus Electrothrix sp. Rat3]|nr:glycosyltransferase family 4 protein [Candidatus Electrothrix rattekaaiensis]
MRILTIANTPPYVMGGAEIQAYHLAKEWVKKGHEVTVAGNRNETGKILFSEDSNIGINSVKIKIKNYNKFTRALSYTISLSWFLAKKRKKFDIIYCRFVKEPTIVVCFLKLFGVIDLPLFSCTECTGNRGEAYFLSTFWSSKWIVKLINKYNNIINIISPDIEKELVSIGLNKEKFSYIPNGTPISSEYFPCNDEKEKKDLVFVGRLVKRKNVDILIKAVKKLTDSGKNISLSIIGTGPVENELKELSDSLSLQKNIFFMGFVEENKKLECIAQHKIFVLPSMLEGFGIVVIEAMKIGLPVIVTNCGGPEFFVDNSVGRVAQAGSVDSLADSIKDLFSLETEQLDRMGVSAQKKVMENYNILTLAERHLDIFRQLI